MTETRTFRIRKESPEDWHEAEYVAMKAFSNLHGMGGNDHYLIHQLRKSASYIPELTRLAVVDERVVGAIYYSVSKVVDEVDQIEHETISFGPLCVDPEYQNRGIGQALMAETFELAKEMGYTRIIIFGEPDYYPKVGFKTCDCFQITTSWGANFPAFMGLELVDNAFEGIRGKFYADPVFDDLPQEQVEAYNLNFPYLKKMRLPGQWDFAKTEAYHEPYNIVTDRLVITRFDDQMAQLIHEQSLDENNRKFVPDEVFESIEEAQETIGFLKSVYEDDTQPQVYPVTLKCGLTIGYVQLVPIQTGWEVGYHIGEAHQNRGYATEALRAFLKVMVPKMKITSLYGICHVENKASQKVLSKCGFQEVERNQERVTFQYAILKKKLRVDVNSDLGESFGPYKIGCDEEVIQRVSSVNIACGWHAGDPFVMNHTVELAIKQGVGIGAHPGFPDLNGFGRRNLSVTPEEMKLYTMYQVGALQAFVKAHGGKLNHVKPHGAMYNMAAVNYELAKGIAESIRAIDDEIILLGLAGSELIRAGRDLGLRVAEEVFADRAYQEDGSLVPRNQPGAVLHSLDEALNQVIQMVTKGTVTTITGKEIAIQADSICVHGDNPQAVHFVEKIREALKCHGIEVQPLDVMIPYLR